MALGVVVERYAMRRCERSESSRRFDTRSDDAMYVLVERGQQYEQHEQQLPITSIAIVKLPLLILS